MASLHLPVFTKHKYSMLEMIVEILDANPGARFTAAQIDHFFNIPQVASHIDRRGAQDPVKSIIWCYEKYHDKGGKFPELEFDGTYFYLASMKQNPYSGQVFANTNRNNSNFNYYRGTGKGKKQLPVNSEETDEFFGNFGPMQETHYDTNRYSNSRGRLGKIKVPLAVLILLVLACFFNLGSIREYIIKLVVLIGTLFACYKMVTAKNTGFNLAGRIIFAIIVFISVYAGYLCR